MIRPLAGVSVGWLGISMVADGVPALLVPHQVASAGGDATQLGLLTLAALGLAALIQPVAGALSDRVGRAPIIAVGVVAAAAGLWLLLTPSWLAPATILALVGVSIVQAGYQGLMPDTIGLDERGRAAGAKGMFDVGGAFLAFAVLAAVLARGDVRAAVTVLSVGLAASVALGLLLLARRPAARAIRERGPDGGRGRARALMQLVVARFLFLLGIYATGRFLLLFVGDRLGLPPDAAGSEAGLILTVLTAVTVIAAVPAGWLADRAGRRPIMGGGALLGAAGMTSLAAADSAAAMLAAGSLMAVGTATFGAGSWALLTDVTAGARAGRLLGLANLGTAGAAAAAGLFGLVIDAGNRAAPGAGYPAAFALASAAALTGGVLAWRLPDPGNRPALHPALEVPQ